MNRALRLPLCTCAWVAVTLSGVELSAASSLTVHQRIDRLLQHRLKPQPLPINPPNPFRMAIGARRESNGADPGSKTAPGPEKAIVARAAVEEHTKDAGPSQLEVLISCATKLKLGGVILLKDQIQIVVNGVPRKEGDSIAADWNNTIVNFRISRLLPGHMVLRYGDAEATVKF